ncbi:MAG: PEGA domain-containing protein, partial [Gammaproteobacteria bacterium]
TKLIESSNSIPCNNCSTLALLGELQKYRLREGYDSPSLLKNFSAYKYKSPSLPDKLISINLTTNPPSSIFINNKNMGTSPIELSAEVNEQIEVSFLDINHKRLNKKIKFNKNQSLSFDLTPIEGSLYLKSIPPKASVFVNGKSLGKTPKEIKKIKLTESVNITLKLDNYIEQEFTFRPRSENRETQTIELERGIGFLRVKHDGDPAKIIVYSNDKLLGPLAKFANDTIVLEAGKNKVKLIQGEVSKEETFDIKMDNFLDWEVTFVESVEISISF